MLFNISVKLEDSAPLQSLCLHILSSMKSGWNYRYKNCTTISSKNTVPSINIGITQCCFMNIYSNTEEIYKCSHINLIYVLIKGL